MQKYTKLIIALAGMLLPFLNETGVALPEFLTIDWVNGLILLLTPVAVWFFPNVDKNGVNVSTVRSPTLVGVLALLIGALAMSGCAGTRAAYDAAEGINQTAKVIGEHYFSVVREANALDDQGQLTPAMLSHVQDLARTTRPVINELAAAGSAYEAVQSAETEAELERAISQAAIAVSRMIDAIKGRSSSTELLNIEREIDELLAESTVPIPVAA